MNLLIKDCITQPTKQKDRFIISYQLDYKLIVHLEVDL